MGVCVKTKNTNTRECEMMRHSLAASAVLAAIIGSALPAAAESLKDTPKPSPAPVHYFRIEAGNAWSEAEEGTWVSPGGERGNWRLQDDETFVAGIAIGRTIVPGIRGDVSLTLLPSQNYDGCRIPGGKGNVPACGDASVMSSADTRAVMANIFIEPLTLMGHASRIRPFLTAGIGVAWNEMGSWTRIQADADQPVRTFNGDTETGFIWTVGGGASIDLASLFGGYPVALDVTYRYIDAGHVEGGLVADVGKGIPQEALNYDLQFHAVTAGIRVPF